jgi:NAD-dependent SIR2 family protein deacetylase
MKLEPGDKTKVPRCKECGKLFKLKWLFVGKEVFVRCTHCGCTCWHSSRGFINGHKYVIRPHLAVYNGNKMINEYVDIYVKSKELFDEIHKETSHHRVIFNETNIRNISNELHQQSIG